MQALSSYVFIAANVILHAKKEIQFEHLNELLPPIVPLLTSHHHSLRGFTQVSLHKDGQCFKFNVEYGVYVLYKMICRYWCIMFLKGCHLIQISLQVLASLWRRGALWI